MGSETKSSRSLQRMVRCLLFFTAILFGECLSFGTGALGNLGYLAHPGGDILRCQTVSGGDFSQFDHVKEKYVQRLNNCTRLALGQFGDVLPVVHGRMERQLAQVPALIATLAEPEGEDGRDGGEQATDKNSKESVTHMLIGVIIGQILGAIKCVAFILWYEGRPYKPWRPKAPNDTSSATASKGGPK